MFAASSAAATFALASGCGDNDRNGIEAAPPSSGFGNDGGGAPEVAVATCSASSLGIRRRPLDLFVMVDKSGSVAGTPWESLRDSLKDFAKNPPEKDISFALNYFSNLEDTCGIGVYSRFAVGLTPLPDMEGKLAASLDATNASGASPVGAALEGALLTATKQKDLAPDHGVVVALVTDGFPSGCPRPLDEPALAQAAFRQNGTRTFAIVTAGGSIAYMNAIAKAGGTDRAIVIANRTQLGDALRKAQFAAVACELVVPSTTADGRAIDPHLVNVTVTSDGASRTIPSLVSPIACENDEGWYYDDPTAPKAVRLCPASCALVQAKPDAEVDVSFGCKTEIK